MRRTSLLPLPLVLVLGMDSACRPAGDDSSGDTQEEARQTPPGATPGERSLPEATPGGPDPGTATPGSAVDGKGPARGLAVEVRGLETERSESPVVLLGPADGSLVVPIRIGPAEALAIAFQLAKHPSTRPLTHDLFGSLLDATSATLESVTVTELREETFYATLSLLVDGRLVDLDSRPSDAIAIAMRLKAPIYVSDQVLGAAGIRRPGRQTRTKAALGIAVQPLTPSLAHSLGLPREDGVLVADVKPGSPAAGSGLLPGDLILSVGGRSLASVPDFEHAAETASGSVELEFQRGRTRLRASIPPR